MAYRYYSIARPVSIGTFPATAKVEEIKNFDVRTYCPDIDALAWGYLDLLEPLSEKEASSYELMSSEAKEWICVTSAVYDDGRVRARITNRKRAVRKPNQRGRQTSHYDLYMDWFASEEEANAFIADVS